MYVNKFIMDIHMQTPACPHTHIHKYLQTYSCTQKISKTKFTTTII
jgi:hypothetical protein